MGLLRFVPVYTYVNTPKFQKLQAGNCICCKGFRMKLLRLCSRVALYEYALKLDHIAIEDIDIYLLVVAE
jgi:hypothetical protein